ncbi:hypothetical protein ACQB60_18895 [Actinomycetota bacterium Odt1-20B]
MSEQYAIDDECGGGWRVEEVEGVWIRQRFSEERLNFLPAVLFDRLTNEARALQMTLPQYLAWIVDKAEGALVMMRDDLTRRQVSKDDPEYELFGTWMATRAVVMERQALTVVRKGQDPVWVVE